MGGWKVSLDGPPGWIAILEPRYHKPWSADEVATLERLYATTSTPSLAEQLGRSQASVQGKATALGLTRTEEYRRQRWRACGRDLATHPRSQETRFGAPRGPRGHRFDGTEGVATRFKAGHRPRTWVPVGTVTEHQGYLWRKVRDTRRRRDDWKPEHHLVWEHHHRRKVPEDRVVLFRNGKTRDFRPENLELVTRAELMRRNSIHNLPPELKGAIRALASLERRIRKARSHGNEEHD